MYKDSGPLERRPRRAPLTRRGTILLLCTALRTGSTNDKVASRNTLFVVFAARLARRAPDIIRLGHRTRIVIAIIVLMTIARAYSPHAVCAAPATPVRCGKRRGRTGGR